MADSDFDKDFLPIYCEDCKQQGYIFEDDINQPRFVVCSRCGWETSQVWCPRCGMGGCFIENLSAKPAFWVCSRCKTKYDLPDSFYEEPIRLYLADELSPEVLQRVEPPKNVALDRIGQLMVYILTGELILFFVFIKVLGKPLLAALSFVVMIVLLIILGLWAKKITNVKSTQ